MPEYSPAYPPLPYYYKNYRRLSVYCKAQEKAIREFLPKPLEYVGNEIEVFILKNPEMKGLDPYEEGGIVIRAKYKDIIGAYIAYEFVTSDEALLAGREFWGYPKKIAQVTLHEDDKKIIGVVKRKNKEIIRAEFTQNDDAKFDVPKLFPRIQIKRIPKADKPGLDVDKVILMFDGTGNEFDSSAIHSVVNGNGIVTFEQSDNDPLYKLGPVEIIGARFAVGDFVLDYGKDITNYEPKR